MTSRRERRLRRKTSAAGLLDKIRDDRWATGTFTDAARWRPDSHRLGRVKFMSDPHVNPPAHFPLPHPSLGRWVWRGTCVWCGTSFGGYENDHTDPMKHHYEYCDKYNQYLDEMEHEPDGPDSIVTR